jgi:HPt (histidine-containing phosphotransfer) domain-containing protein
MNAAASQDQELHQIQRDYLKDLDEQVGLVKMHARALGSRAKFKTSYPVLLYIAHQLKGSGGTIGFPEISAAGRRLSETLDTFLSDTEKRPSPGELSKRVSAIAEELEKVVGDAKKRTSE